MLPPVKQKATVRDVKASLLIFEAKRWIGITEIGKNNYGQMVERFQKAVDGKAVGEPWCLSFVQFCVKAIDEMCEDTQLSVLNLSKPAKFFNTEHCMTAWNNAEAWQKLTEPEIGSICIWQYYDSKGKPTSSGHAGIVAGVKDKKTFLTVEGNTSSSSKVDREGDGVYLKERKMTNIGQMRIKGFLRLW